MVEYIYTRSLNSGIGLYNIDYGVAADGITEEAPLAKEVVAEFVGKTVGIKCNGTEVKIIINPALTTEEETTLNNLVTNHV